MPGRTRYTVRAPQVVHETVDGEVVAIDFERGTYFSLTGPAEAVWAVVTPGATAPEVCAALRDRYDTTGIDLDAAVGTFLSSLVEEGLVVEADAGAAQGADAEAPESQAPAGPPAGLLGELRIEKFTDMEQIILLDPVHDVTEQGWPHARPEDATSQP
jgi:hypothetical protein